MDDDERMSERPTSPLPLTKFETTNIFLLFYISVVVWPIYCPTIMCHSVNYRLHVAGLNIIIITGHNIATITWMTMFQINQVTDQQIIKFAA